MEKLDTHAISKRTVNGIFALASRSLILQIVNFGTFLVISVVLSAGQLGIYTAVVAIQRVVSFFTDFGLGAALVQKKNELTREDLVTTFTIQASVTLVIFLGFVIFIDPIKEFFKLNAQGGRLLLALVFTIFVSSFKTIPSILLERNINFSRLVIPQIGESLVFNVVLLLTVVNHFGIDSYTIAFLISSLVGIPLYYYISPWKPGVGIYRTSLSDLKFGAQFQAKNILATIKDDFLTVILIKFLPFAQIGYIGFAQKLAFFIYRYITDSVTKVTFSSYSRIQHDVNFLKRAIEKSLFFTGVVIFPLLSGLIVISPYLIQFVPRWSHKWEPALISLVFFSLNAIISSMSGVLVNVLDATGRVRTTLKLMVFWTILTWVLTPLAIYFYGYNGVAMASFLVTLTIFLTIYLVKKVVDFDFIKSIYKPAVSAIIMIFIVFGFTKVVQINVITLGFAIILGGTIYSGLLYLLAGKEIMADVKKILLK